MKLYILLLCFLTLSMSVLAQETMTTKNQQSSSNKPSKTAKNTDLRDELFKRLAAARDVRTDLEKKFNGSIPSTELSLLMKIDNENNAWLKLAIEKYGWLGISLVGEDGEDAAFRLIINASREAEFQKHCLELLKKAVKEGEAPAEQVELLTDRINAIGGQSPAGSPNRAFRKIINVTTINSGNDIPATPKVKNPQLRDEILQRIKSDQAVRIEAVKNYPPGQKLPDEVLARFKAADKADTDWMKETINKYGYPGYGLVGQDGEQAAFVMIQHADLDLEFQKQCLMLLRKAVELKDASPVSLAYLTDRVLIAEGKPQIYGTQTQIFNGEIKPAPIEDETNVDKRRATISLEPLADYLKVMQQRYKKPVN